MGQWYLLSDSTGKKSVSYTMMVATFVVCTLWLGLSVFEKIHHLEIREFDAGGASVWFAPFAALYFGRKWQSKDDLVKSAIAAKADKDSDSSPST
jgi:hypothetical protein